MQTLSKASGIFSLLPSWLDPHAACRPNLDCLRAKESKEERMIVYKLYINRIARPVDILWKQRDRGISDSGRQLCRGFNQWAYSISDDLADIQCPLRIYRRLGRWITAQWCRPCVLIHRASARRFARRVSHADVNTEKNSQLNDAKNHCHQEWKNESELDQALRGATL